MGSEKIELPAWKSGLPTPVQGLSPNFTALTLLDGFAKGNIQMQGEAVKHLQEGNLAKLRNIMIELMEPDRKVLENVNFLEVSAEKVKEPTIGELLGELELGQGAMVETVTNVCSMGKQKKGKTNPTEPSPASKAMAKRGSKKEKPKPAPKSGFGPSRKTTPAGKEKQKTTTLKQNPRKNLETGVTYTTVVERGAIQRLLEGRGKRKAMLEKESSSSEGEAVEKMGEKESEGIIEGAPKERKTSKDLVAKKKTRGGASKGRRSRKGATPTSRSKGKKVQMKKVPSKGDSDRKH